MSARVWTREELMCVWPVEGYEWGHISGSVWALYGIDDVARVICFNAIGQLVTTVGLPPGPAIAAAWGAHQGRDSVEWMAAKLDEDEATASKVDLIIGREGFDDGVHLGESIGREKACRECALMLRRGTVAP